MKKTINMALVWFKSLRPNLLSLVQPQEELPKFNLIIIGSAKCGTTSLNQYLKQHPDVYLSSDVGINNETGLFLNNSFERIKSLSNKRIRQYLNDKALQKAITKNYRGEKILAEESTDYTKFPFRTVNHKLIKQQSENLKLLFIIRDPVRKIYSQYRHFRRHLSSNTSSNIAEEMQCNRFYIKSSCYYFQLQQFLTHFSDHNLKVVLLEDLENSPADTLKSIFEFLDISTDVLPKLDLSKKNVNNQIEEKDFDVDLIPSAQITELLCDTKKLESFLDMSLLEKWPLLRRANDNLTSQKL